MEEKPFDAASIVIIMILAIGNDLLEVVGDASALLPVIGIVTAGFVEIINFLLWALILFWFIIKLENFGAVGLLQVAGGIAEFFGIPARALTAGIGLYLANNPQAAEIAMAATGKLGKKIQAPQGKVISRPEATTQGGVVSKGEVEEKPETAPEKLAPKISEGYLTPKEVGEEITAPETKPKEKVSEEALGMKKEISQPMEALKGKLLETPAEIEKNEEGENKLKLAA